MSDPSLRPLSALVELVTDRALTRKDMSKVYVGLEHIPSGGSTLMNVGSAQDSISTNGIFREGDILFGKLRPTLQKSIRAQTSGYCSTDILVLRPRSDVNPAYAGYVAQSDAVFARAIQTEEGTKMPRCSWKALNAVTVFAPMDTHVQQRIAAVLGRVDDAIEHTQALIEKHQQIKAGLMYDLFTRGALSNGQLRQHFAEAPDLFQRTAIGPLPREWRRSTVGELFAIDSGITLGPHRRPLQRPRKYLRVANVHRDQLRLDDVASIEMLHGDAASTLDVGDLLVVEGHANPSEIGRCAMVDQDAAGMLFQNHLFRLRATGVDRDFALLWLNSFHVQRYWERTCSTSSGLHTINRRMLEAVPLFVPSQAEQRRIVSVAASIRAVLDGHIRTLTKLRAQKLGLMQDLLTGRVRVSPTSTAPSHA